MSKGKSEFRFTINADHNSIENVIQGFLRINEYSKIATNDNANYYLYNDLFSGKRSLEYYINGNEVIILAYLGTYKKPKPLEGFVGALPKQVYREKLSQLFSELQKLNMQPQNNMYNANEGMYNNNNMYNANQGMYNNNNMYNNNQNINNTNMTNNPNYYMANNVAMQANNSFNVFQNENNSRNEKFAIAGFVLSLLGLFMSFFGYIYGAIIILFEFYCASLGLKTQTKRGLAIATIVIASLSILITIIELILLFV